MSYRRPIWKNAYKVDFTSLTTQNLRTGGNGTKTIDGKNWTWANDANVNTADVTNGTGIVIGASNANVNYNGATRNCPILSVPISTLFPNFDIFNHTLRIQARLLLAGSITNFEFAGMGFEYTTTPTNQNYHMLKGFNTTPNRIQSEDSIGGTTTIRQVQPSSTDDILSIIYRGPVSYKTQSGAFSTFPLGDPTTERLTAHQTGTLSIQTSGQLAFAFYYVTLNTQAQTDGFTITWTHLQLDYLEALPVVGGY